MTSDLPRVEPALAAIKALRVDVKKRIGKEGGNLNQLILQRLDTVEAVLLQIPSIEGMISVIGQQAQLATHTIRNMSREMQKNADQFKQLQLQNGDDDPSETKGE